MSARAWRSLQHERWSVPSGRESWDATEVVASLEDVLGFPEAEGPARVEGIPLGVILEVSPVVVDVDADDGESSRRRVAIKEAAFHDGLREAVVGEPGGIDEIEGPTRIA
jgi:hypothetical protein